MSEIHDPYDAGRAPATGRTATVRHGADRIDVHHDRAGTTPSNLVRRVSWGAIFAGAAIGVATLLLLTLLGLGIGTATLDPAPGGDGTPGAGALASGSGIWLVVSQLVALLVGGYVAGRLAGVPKKQGSLLHGVAVWAVTTIAMFWLATTAIGNVAGGAASMLSSAGGGIASATQAVVPDDLAFEDLVPNVEMSDLPPEVRQTMREEGLTPEDVRTEAADMARSVVGPEERSRALDILRSTATDVLQSPGDASQDVSAAADQLFAGPDAVISDEDRDQLTSELSSRFGVSEREAQQTIERWQARATETVNAAERNLAQARDQAAQAAQSAAEGVSTAAFLAFVASLLGLIAAAVGGLLGRPKDELAHDDARADVRT